jgi:hypothetical protein
MSSARTLNDRLEDAEAYPVLAVRVAGTKLACSTRGVPEITPSDEMDSPVGNPVDDQFTTNRSLSVLAVIRTGVMALFWMRVWAGAVEKVKTSSTTAKLTSRVAVAGDPVDDATIRRVPRGVFVSGTPPSVAVVPETSSVRPVPASAGALKDTPSPASEVADQEIGAG